MTLTFASPNWAWCLFVLPLIALLKIAADARARQVTLVFAASERLRALFQGGTSLVLSGVRFGLQLLGFGFFILALTRPQMGSEERQIDQTGRNILIAIDCSKSMLADDVKPNRLIRARLAAQDLLEKLPGDRVGLIAFAGRAFIQAPLTTDHEALIESIQALNHTTIPRGGSSLGACIALALNTVEKMPGRQHGLIIFTDGQETDSSMMETARNARAKNLLVLPVGVGTTAGELIPDPDPEHRGEYLRDENGNVIRTRLESAALQDLARVSGGEYVELNSQSLSQTVVDRLLSNLEKHRADSRNLSRPIERYQLLVFAGIVCIVMALIIPPSSRPPVSTAPLPVNPLSTVHQRPVLLSKASPIALAAVLLLGAGGSATAATREELSSARGAYDKQQWDRARDAYQRMFNDKKSPKYRDETAYGLGASTFQLQDYEASERAFSDALKSPDTGVQRRAQRGLATALYDQGNGILAKQPERTIKLWTESRDHFDAAMHLAPKGSQEYTQLRENRDFVQKRLDELKKAQAALSPQQQAGDQKGKGQGSGQAEGQQKPEDEGDRGEGPPKPQGNESEAKKTDSLSKDKSAVPEGQIQAADSGKQEEQQNQGAREDEKRNDKTGFTPQEARSRLRSYSDDKKSAQYLMREEKPHGGKDY